MIDAGVRYRAAARRLRNTGQHPHVQIVYISEVSTGTAQQYEFLFLCTPTARY